MQQIGRDSGGGHRRAIQVPWLRPSHLIYLLLVLATSITLVTCRDLNDDALKQLNSTTTTHSNHRHTRRVLIVQDETVAGEQNFQGRRPLNGSGESSVDSAYESTEEDEEQDDDLLQEEEFKRRRLIDVADSSTVKAAAGGEGLLAATNSTTTRRRTQETPARASPQDEEGEESPNQVQVHLVKQQQPTTEPSEAGLLAAFFSHIDKQWKFAEIVLIIVISAILNLVTIIGNIMVLISFKMDRSLQTVSNYFLLSLALADLLIGLISMPLYTLYLLLNYWPLGPLMCDIWLAIDYLNSNAAVLNMLIISFDRYFSVTRPLTYRAKRTTKHACLMISFAWLLSLTIWTPAIFTYPYYKGRTVQGTDKCEIEFVKANTYLTFVTAILAFYIPVAIMIYLYWRIWLETKKRYRDLTTLFLVSGVGAAAPTRPRPPAALSGHLTGRAGGGGGDDKHASLWARNLARARLYAPSLMRGPQKAASLTPRDSSPLKLCNDQRPPPSPPVSTVTSKTGRPAPTSLAINEPTPAQVGCDRHASVAGDASKPSKVAVVQAIDSEKVESIRSQPSQQQVPSMPSQELARHLARQRCKCRACNSLGQPGQSHGLSPDCKVCARDAMSSISGQGRHKCSASRKGTTCCCCSNSHATGTIVQPHQHNRTKYDFTKQHTTSSCRYCANLSNKLTSRGQRPAVVSHTHSPRAKVARSEGGPDLLQLADDAQPITGKAATFGSRSSLCQRSKIHPKEDAKPGSSESDEAAAPGTKLLVDVATSPINFSNTSLAPASSSSATHHHHQLDDNVIQQQQQQQQQLGAPLTPVSPEVEDFETRIVSYGHKFHFETDDPKLASKRDQRTNQPGAGGAYNPCHYHHHHQHHNHRKHHQHHNHTQMSSTGWKMPAGGGGGKSAPGKHVGATCCCAEVISAHDAECRFCRPAHRPTTHQQLGTRHAHHHHQHSPAGHAHQHRHHHSHHVHSGHGHHQHHHHNNNHHHHHHHHNHHHSKHTAHKHASPGKQCNKCPQVVRSPPARAPTDSTTIERDVALGSSLPILAALQNTHAAAAATNSAKKYGQKLTFSDILMERSSSCVALEQQQRPDKSNSLQVALQVAAAHERQSSPAVSESERELLARRNADRLRSAFEYEAEEEDEDGAISDIEAEGQQGRPNWLMRLLILVGLAAPRSTSRRSASYQANQRRQRPQHVHEPQTTDSSDSSDPQQAKLRSQQPQQPQQHSSSTKSSSSGSQQHHQAAPSPHATGSERHYNNHSHHHHHHHHHHPIQPKSERKAAKTLSTLLLVFIVTWLPYNVLVLIKTLSGGEDMVPEKIWNFSYYLCYINSTINPLCYALCNAQFRRTYMRILKCKLSNEHNSTRRLVAIQTGAGGGGGGSSTAACSTWNKENASRLNSSSLDGAHLLNHSSSGATLGGGGGSGPLAAAGRHRQSSASNGAHRHSGGSGGDGRRS